MPGTSYSLILTSELLLKIWRELIARLSQSMMRREAITPFQVCSPSIAQITTLTE